MKSNRTIEFLSLVGNVVIGIDLPAYEYGTGSSGNPVAGKVMFHGRRICITLLVLASLCFSVVINAEPYQFEIGADVSRNTIRNPIGPDVESALTSAQLTYHLRPVMAATGPLAERAFLFRSAFVAGSFRQSSLEQGPVTEFLDVRTRFVTQDDLILEFGFNQVDPLNKKEEGDAGSRDLTFGLGKYLDNRSFAILSLTSAEGFMESRTLMGRYRRLTADSASGRYAAYGLGLAYIDSDESNFDESLSGYRLDVDGTYYLSRRLSAGMSVSYLSSGAGSSRVSLRGEYFFTRSLFGGIDVVGISDLPDLQVKSYGVEVGARF